MRPQFKYSDLGTKHFKGGDIHASGKVKDPWITPENIAVRNIYSKADLEGMEHLDYAAGLPPFLRRSSGN